MREGEANVLSLVQITRYLFHKQIGYYGLKLLQIILKIQYIKRYYLLSYIMR